MVTSPYPYFYGDQADAFSYYRIPRALITGREFRHVSTDAKLLYGLLLDRMGLSSRNGWVDSHPHLRQAVFHRGGTTPAGSRLPEVGKSDVWKSEKSTSRGRKIRPNLS